MPGNSEGRLEGRNGAIWAAYCAGATQEALAEEYDLSQTRVSQIIREARAAIPATDLDEARTKHVDFLDKIRREAAEIAAMPAAQAYSNGRPMVTTDEHGNETPTLDYGGKLKAMETAVRIGERAAKLLGLDAPAKVEHGLTDQATQAAVQAAADAMSRLHGGPDSL